MPFQHYHRAALIFIVFAWFDWLPKMGATECFSTTNGRMAQFYCSPSEQCCGSRCCQDEAPFYKHWYFWLAVCMFMLVLVGVALSACRHFRKERKRKSARRGRCGCALLRNKAGVTPGGVSLDLLLNYHLLRTEVATLPQYDNLVPSRPPHSSPPSTHLPPPPPPHLLCPPPLLLPPTYCEACTGGNSYNNTSSSLSEGANNQPPPSYTECVMQN